MNITASLTNSLGTITLPDLEVALGINKLELATDITTLGNDMYTDFMPKRRRQWDMPFSFMDEDTYNAIQAVYASQFTTGDYPTITIEHYNVYDVPVRMYLNDAEVWNDCGSIQNIKLSFSEQYATGTAPSFLLLEPDSKLIMDASGYLII